jgi:hypothetical protein
VVAKLPKLQRQASGKTKPKAVAKANPTNPADRQYPWGSKNPKGPTATPQPRKRKTQ